MTGQARGRRLPGEGSIYQRADGRWVGVIEAGWGATRKRRSVYGKTKAEAAQKMRAIQRADGPVASAGPPTWAAWSKTYLTVISPGRGVKPRTLEGYVTHLTKHVDPVLGKLALDKIRAEHIEAVKARLAVTVTGTTALHCFRTLSHALKVAVQWEHIQRNPCDLVSAPSATTKRAQPLDRDQAKAVLEAARGQWNAARWTVALALGLRQSEALGLMWTDIDLAAGTLTVDQQLDRVSLRMSPDGSRSALKSESSQRTIALPPALLSELRAHRAGQVEHRLQVGSMWRDLGYVFPRQDGSPGTHRADRTAWGLLLAEAGVPHLPLHAARHTAATLLLLQGVDVKVVQQILGHSSSTLTRDTYQHVTPEIARDAADRMNQALWG